MTTLVAILSTLASLLHTLSGSPLSKVGRKEGDIKSGYSSLYIGQEMVNHNNSLSA